MMAGSVAAGEGGERRLQFKSNENDSDLFLINLKREERWIGGGAVPPGHIAFGR
jgi:hypothetical protein